MKGCGTSEEPRLGMVRIYFYYFSTGYMSGPISLAKDCTNCTIKGHFIHQRGTYLAWRGQEPLTHPSLSQFLAVFLENKFQNNLGKIIKKGHSVRILDAPWV